LVSFAGARFELLALPYLLAIYRDFRRRLDTYSDLVAFKTQHRYPDA
jgi:hypothetical protein